jgi:hypothetical protein
VPHGEACVSLAKDMCAPPFIFLTNGLQGWTARMDCKDGTTGMGLQVWDCRYGTARMDCRYGTARMDTLAIMPDPDTTRVYRPLNASESRLLHRESSRP